jgi:Spy/CpxP family protein refolding chaperone
MKRMGFSMLIAAVVGAAAFSIADAQGRGGRGPGGGPGFGRGVMHVPGVELTDAQREQVRAILDAERPARQGPPAEMTLHRQLRAELLADTPDDQKIEGLRQQIAEASAASLARHIAVQRKIAQILTPEQRAIAREALAKAPQGRMGRGPGGPRGFRSF